ncbi:Pycsar system effector family protein [Streptomyces griseorubiginosus]|uniref:Pycsar system effector family protein n=1 Tax=Streptomyces griseorubiginosus TaxID=67304 RepID=UPI0036DFCEBE
MTSDEPEAAHYVAERLLLTVREDLGRADVKASILLSGAVAVPALVLGRGAPSDVSGIALGLLATGGGLWAIGTLLLLAVVLPRTGTVRSVPGPTYYADGLPTTDLEALRRATAEAGADRLSWLLTQFQDVSVILSAKYRWLRRSMALLGAGLLFAFLAVAVG